MTPESAALLFAAGVLASGINSVAGGGSLISFPVLTYGLAIPNREANATNAVGLFPGSFSGGVGFLSQFPKTKKYLVPMLAPTVTGSLIGAGLMLLTTESIFRRLVPALILFAALLLWFRPRIRDWVQARKGAPISLRTGALIQLGVAIYGGYFGAGMGIMMLAAFGLFMDGDTHELNAVKNWLGSIINLVCSGVFLLKGLILLPEAGVMALGGLVGGFAAARWSLRIDSEKLRRAVALYGFVMTGYTIWRTLNG